MKTNNKKSKKQAKKAIKLSKDKLKVCGGVQSSSFSAGDCSCLGIKLL